MQLNKILLFLIFVFSSLDSFQKKIDIKTAKAIPTDELISRAANQIERYPMSQAMYQDLIDRFNELASGILNACDTDLAKIISDASKILKIIQEDAFEGIMHAPFFRTFLQKNNFLEGDIRDENNIQKNFLNTIKKKRMELIKFVQEKKKAASENAISIFIDKIREGNKEEAEKLLKIGKIDINAKDANGRNALIFAILNKPNMIEFLLNNGADPNVKFFGEDALMWAVPTGKENIVQLILKSKIDLTAKNKSNETALDMAKRLARTVSSPHDINPEIPNVYEEIAKMLIRAGAK